MFWVPNEEKNVGHSLDEILKYFKASKMNWIGFMIFIIILASYLLKNLFYSLNFYLIKLFNFLSSNTSRRNEGSLLFWDGCRHLANCVVSVRVRREYHMYLNMYKRAHSLRSNHFKSSKANWIDFFIFIIPLFPYSMNLQYSLINRNSKGGPNHLMGAVESDMV